MRRIRSLVTIFICTLISFFTSACSVHSPQTPSELSYGLEGVSYTPRQPESWVLPNGLQVLYMKDEELPLVQGALFVRGGSLWEPDDQLGVAGVTGDQMRQGGAGERGPEALDRELERLAASVSSNIGAEYGKIAFSCLHSDLEAVFSIFSDVAFRPRFEPDRLDLWKGQALEGVRRRTDDPGTVAGIAFAQLLYGTSVYGRVPTDKEIRAISRPGLEAFHRQFMQPTRSLLVISGKVEREKVAQLIEKEFGNWTGTPDALPPPPGVNQDPSPGIYFLSFPFAQSTILMGELGPRRLTPDYPAIESFNEVFGSSGFSARLTRRVRTELGLAYGVFGGILPGVVKGRSLVELQTKAESTGQAIVESVDTLRGLQSRAVAADELGEARRSITNSFVFKFDTTEELLQRAALLKMLDYPSDYDVTYVGKIRAVSEADIQTVAKKYWDPAKFVVVVVGNETAYNSLQKALEANPEALPGLHVQKMRFDQKLVF